MCNLINTHTHTHTHTHPCAMTPVCAILSKTKRRYGVRMNHLFPDILPVFCSTFSWLWSLGRVLFLSCLFGLVWVDAFLVEWIPFADFDDESKI